jgi:flagellar motor switch protein FliM
VTLSTTLKKSVTVNVTNTDFLRMSDYLANILLPTSLNIVSMPDLNGSLIMVASSKLTYALVDAYYGGSERPFSKIGGRDEFTSIENNMINKICQLALRDLREAWKLNYPLQLEYVRSEANPQFLGVIHASELVAVVTFEVELEHVSGPFILILQLRALDSIQHALSVNVTGEGASDVSLWRAHWLRELGQLPLSVRVELGRTNRALRDLRDMKVGDILPLGQDAAEALSVFVEELPKLKGMIGVFRGNTAVQVTERLAGRTWLD